MASGPPCSLLFLFLSCRFIQLFAFFISTECRFQRFVLFAVLSVLRCRFVVGCLRVALALWFLVSRSAALPFSVAVCGAREYYNEKERIL
jgi:hypothetical protein